MEIYFYLQIDSIFKLVDFSDIDLFKDPNPQTYFKIALLPVFKPFSFFYIFIFTF